MQRIELDRHRAGRALLAAALVVLLVDVAVVVARGGGARGGDGGSAVPRPPAGQVEVTGDATAVEATVQVASPLATPFTVEVAPGAGGATIQDALVDGARTSIVWGGGRPLALFGEGGALLVGPATTLEAGEAAVVWRLDGPVHGFRPGQYRIDSAVAVGAGSLGAPRDTVTFEADAQTTMRTNGGTLVRGPRVPLALEGPGRARITGALALRTDRLDATATSALLEAGPFTVSLVPGTETWTVEAVLQGSVQSEPPLAAGNPPPDG